MQENKTENDFDFDDYLDNEDYLKIDPKTKLLKNQNLAKLDDNDLKILKNSLLFINWNEHTFKMFVNDDRIF